MNSVSANDVHRTSIVIDGLNASWFYVPSVLERLALGGVTAVNATIAAWHDLPQTMTLIADLLALVRAHQDRIMQVVDVADIGAAKTSGRVGLILGFQDTAPIGDKLQLLAVYRALGVRIVQLTYNHCNRVGCGCLEADDSGLTPFGHAVVGEMNRLGMLIDLSHCGPRTTRDAIEASQHPVAITHANPLARCPNPRNKSDDALLALAARGGIVGAVAFAPMLTCDMHATLDDYLDTIDYLVNLVGIDHVGLGPDFMEEMPAEIAAQALRGMRPEVVKQFASVTPTTGFASIAECANVTHGLLARGYPPDDVRKLIGGNWLRLYQAVW
ncbi:membrane dipeptidase [Caldilinea sp.]|uniref:dipeptidase n=1 Tax=Caldilinea sp. TaxID=2293560 RepID=UPI002C7AE4D8|nr:membrane dipeptidase [Caldilinea sp.]